MQLLYKYEYNAEKKCKETSIANIICNSSKLMHPLWIYNFD